MATEEDLEEETEMKVEADLEEEMITLIEEREDPLCMKLLAANAVNNANTYSIINT